MGRHRKRRRSAGRNKKLIIGIVAVVIVIAAVGAGVAVSQSGNRKTEKSAKALEDIQNDKQNNVENNSKKAEERGKDSNPEKSQTAEKGSESRSGKSGGESGSVSGMSITIPFRDDSSGIEIERIDNYSGYYIEDGTEDKVENVAALTLKNNSDQAIEYGNIRLSQGETTLEFQFSLIPAGAQAVVMEAKRSAYEADLELAYEGSTVANIKNMDMAQDSINVTVGSDGGITVTNISQNDIPQLRVFYKNLLDDNVYMGGIAYNAKIEGLKRGESRTVYPSHYDPEHGEIMMVRTYETTQ